MWTLEAMPTSIFINDDDDYDDITSRYKTIVVHWVISLFLLVFRWDFRWVLNSDWDQRSAKNEVIFTLGLSDSLNVSLKPNFGLSDRRETPDTPGDLENIIAHKKLQLNKF